VKDQPRSTRQGWPVSGLGQPVGPAAAGCGRDAGSDSSTASGTRSLRATPPSSTAPTSIPPSSPETYPPPRARRPRTFTRRNPRLFRSGSPERRRGRNRKPPGSRWHHRI